MIAVCNAPEDSAQESFIREKGEWTVDELAELRMEDEREKRADEGKQ